MKCPSCNFEWNRLDICPTLPIHDCSNFQGAKPKAIEPSGPGTELHKLIKRWFREDETADCQCTSRIREMNHQGVAWCKANIDTIVGWLMEEAEKRGLLKSKVKQWAAPKAARLMVKWAIRKARFISSARASP